MATKAPACIKAHGYSKLGVRGLQEHSQVTAALLLLLPPLPLLPLLLPPPLLLLLLLLLLPPPPLLLLIFNLPVAIDASTAKPRLPAVVPVPCSRAREQTPDRRETSNLLPVSRTESMHASRTHANRAHAPGGAAAAVSAVTVAKGPAHVCALLHIQVCVRAGGAAAADPAGPHPRAPRGPHRERAGPAGEGIFVFFSVLLARVFFGARRNRTVGCPLCASKWNTY